MLFLMLLRLLLVLLLKLASTAAASSSHWPLLLFLHAAARKQASKQAAFALLALFLHAHAPWALLVKGERWEVSKTPARPLIRSSLGCRPKTGRLSLQNPSGSVSDSGGAEVGGA